MSPADRTRRSLVQGLVVALGGDQAGALAALGRWARALAAWLAPSAAESAAAPLSAADREDLVAFTGVLVAGAELPDPERAHVLEHLQEAAGSDTQLELYRTTAQVLARLGGARFATLDLPARLALVRRHDLGRSVERPGDSEETRGLRRAVPDLMAAYYGSAAGWAAVGYDVFPGRCGVLERYTRPEA